MKNYYKNEVAKQMIKKYEKGRKSLTLHDFDFDLFWNGDYEEKRTFYDSLKELEEMGFITFKKYRPKNFVKESCRMSIVEENAKAFAESFGLKLK